MTEEKKTEENPVEEAKELTAIALKTALSVSQQQRLLALLDDTPDIVYEIGVTPNQVRRSCRHVPYIHHLSI